MNFFTNIVCLFLAGSLLASSSAVCADALEKPSNEKSFKVMFTPPSGWRLADKDSLSKHVMLMVVGKGTHDFPPSMNLGYDPYQGDLKDYLKIVKEINSSQGCTLKDLGTIKTDAGVASLSQFDEKTEWGEVRQMHAILLRDGVAYILTACALKDEFPSFYQDFFKSMQSLRFEADKPITVGLK